MKSESRIRLTDSVIRSYLLPVFTIKQAVFFGTFLFLAASCVFLKGMHGVPLAIIMLASAAGALSISAPAVMQTSIRNERRVIDALERGGWTKTADATWGRADGLMKSWENDRIQIISSGNTIDIFGPLYTVRRLRASLDKSKNLT